MTRRQVLICAYLADAVCYFTLGVFVGRFLFAT